MAVNPNARIVVVGCGMSGVAAAHRLVRAGFHQVRVVEAAARSGGRVRTGKLGDNIVEIGANWIHGPCEENPVFCLARKYRLLDPEALNPENQAMDVGGHPPYVPNVFCSSGRKLNAEDIHCAQELFAELLDESSKFASQGGEPWASVGDFIRSQVQQRAAEKWKGVDAATRSLRLCMISNMLKLECSINGAHSMDEVGLGAYGLYKTLPGLDCTFPGGYEGVVKNLMAELPSGIVAYNQPVRCVHWNNTEKRENPVMIECDEESIAADHVIVTVPLGYLKKHHSTLFHPPLPLHKLHSVQRLGFGTNNKIFVEFDSPWWDADCEVIYPVWEDEDDMVDQVTDIPRSWIKKLCAFTVLKPTERSTKADACPALFSLHEKITGKSIDLEYSPNVPQLSGTATLCVVGSLDMNQSIWRRCLNKRSHSPSHNSSADLQETLPSPQRGSCAPSGSTTPGRVDLTVTQR